MTCVYKIPALSLLHCSFSPFQIILGNVSSVEECEKWFRCTYLYHRMRSRAIQLGTDLNLDEEAKVLVSKALQVLEKAGMMLYLRAGNFKYTGENL